jgi:outer membrane protein assembly factor BamB
VRRCGLTLLLVLVSLCVAGGAAAESDPRAWTSYGFDNQLGNGIASDTLTPLSVPKLRLDWSQQLDGPIFASPLSASVDGEQLVFAATEGGSVYAVDAATGAIVWQRQLGAVTTPECGNWGITSTGAIDLAGGTLFEISAEGVLHALDLGTGEERDGYPRTLVENNLYEYVWGGLRIAGNRLYAGVASYCDVGPLAGPMPEGRLIAVPLGGGDTAIWDPVPGPGNMGGMWGWGGVSIDPSDGRVFTATGNSHVFSDACGCYIDDAGYGERIVALRPDLSGVLDSNQPGIRQTGDSDFGAAPLLFQPTACPPLAAANNKDGSLYVWNRDHLGAGPILRLPLSDGIAPFVGSPGWSPSYQMVYAAQSVIRAPDGTRVGNGVTAWHVDPGCGFRPIWQTALGDGNQATPLLVGNVLFATGGKPGGLFALSAANGKVLWSAPTAGRTVASMISVAGRVFAGDTAGVLYAFSGLSRPARPCGRICS